MTCSCGDVMTVDADNREEAVTKMKAMMTPEMVASHMAAKHPGQPVPSQAEMGMMVEQKMVAA